MLSKRNEFLRVVEPEPTFNKYNECFSQNVIFRIGVTAYYKQSQVYNNWREIQYPNCIWVCVCMWANNSLVIEQFTWHLAAPPLIKSSAVKDETSCNHGLKLQNHFCSKNRTNQSLHAILMWICKFDIFVISQSIEDNLETVFVLVLVVM